MLNIRGMSIVENFLTSVNRFGHGLTFAVQRRAPKATVRCKGLLDATSPVHFSTSIKTSATLPCLILLQVPHTCHERVCAPPRERMVLAAPPNDPKLSHADRQVAQKPK